MTAEKGKREIGGAEFSTTVYNRQFNKRPTSMWAGLEGDDEERGHLVLMGEAPNVLTFTLAAHDRGCPMLAGLLSRKEGGPFAAVILGSWPNARVQAVIELMNQYADELPKVWARVYLEKLHNDPDRKDCAPPGEADVRFLEKLYSDQCRSCSL